MAIITIQTEYIGDHDTRITSSGGEVVFNLLNSINGTTTGDFGALLGISGGTTGGVTMDIPAYVAQAEIDMTGQVTEGGDPVTSSRRVEVQALLDVTGPPFQEINTGSLEVVAPSTPEIRLQMQASANTVGGGLSVVALSTDASGAFTVRLGGLGGGAGAAGVVLIKAILYPIEGTSGPPVMWSSPPLSVEWEN